MFQKVRHTSEVDRIINLPRRRIEDMPVDLIGQLTELLKTPNGKQTLRKLQALALHDMYIAGGAFCAVEVGGGKTLTSLLAAYVLEAQRPVLFQPAGLLRKTEGERKEYAEHWLVPNHIRLHSYEMLGRVQSAGFLDEYKPDLLIFDEVHKLKNKRAAVTRRVVRYMREHPKTKVVALSGTIMRKSLLDFGHILRWCLKDNAPIPETENELEEWAAAIDEKVDELSRYEPGALLKLTPGGNTVEDARRGFRARLTETPGVVATVGEGERVDCSIYISHKKYNASPITDQHFSKLRSEWATPDGWTISQAVEVWKYAKELALGFHYVRVEKSKYQEWLKDLRQRLKKEHIECGNESGEQRTQKEARKPLLSTIRETKSVLEHCVESDMSKSTASARLSTLSSLHIRETNAQSVNKSPRRKDYTSTTTTELGGFVDFCAVPVTERSDYSLTMSISYREQFPTFLETNRPPREWLQARSEWAAFVREVLSRSRTLDSELQVAQACDAGKLDNSKLETWRAIKDTFKDTTVAVWHDDSALRACVEWMRKPGLVWVEHQFFGQCLAEVSGCKYYGAKGLTDKGEFINNADPKVSAIASIDANREGRNLQDKWSRMLVTSPMEGADVWQQTLGRLHRPGQMADEVEVDVLLGCKEHANAWNRALASAIAIRDTTGADSKLLLADVDWPTDEEIAGFSGARWR